MVMPVMSASWKASVPNADVGTWPVMTTMGSRVHEGVGQGGHDVGGARAAGHHGHPGAAGGVGVALRHVAGALLVAHQDVADGRVDDRVVHRQDGAAGQAEDRFDALHLQALDEGLTTIEFHRRFLARSVFGVRLGASDRKRKRPPAGEAEVRTRGVGRRALAEYHEEVGAGAHHGRQPATAVSVRQPHSSGLAHPPLEGDRPAWPRASVERRLGRKNQMRTTSLLTATQEDRRADAGR